MFCGFAACPAMVACKDVDKNLLLTAVICSPLKDRELDDVAFSSCVAKAYALMPES